MLFTLASISKKPAMLILRGIFLQALLGFSFYSCFFFFVKHLILTALI